MFETFVDTNYFLRLLLKDDLKQHQQAKKLFLAGAKGKIKLASSTIVFFEIYWVLFSFYQKGKKQLTKTLKTILKMNFIDLPEREILLETLSIYNKTSLGLEDSYHLAYIKGHNIEKLASFDVELKRKFLKK